MAERMPAFFIGHGSPMNALATNAWTNGWLAIGASVPRPRAVLAVSAHWYLPATLVTSMKSPRTIHDFGGFPPELYEFNYAAPGDPKLAARVKSLLAPLEVGLDSNWGLDHGTWSVLCHMFPNANVPVVQLSIDETQPAASHYEIGKHLAPLREEGVLIIGSGNLVHNLHAYAWGRHPAEPLDWAVRFDSRARQSILAGDDESLINYEVSGRDAMLSAPTPEHYLPLLYVLAVRRKDDDVSFPIEGFDGGSISMLTIKIG